MTTYAGAALQANTTDTGTGPATSARFNTPKGVAVDTAGNIYIADSVNNSVRKIAVGTGISTTVATGFLTPGGVAVDGAGVIYVADTGHHRIAKIVGVTVTVLAGDSVGAGTSGLVDHATGTTARFFNPSGIAVNSAGTLAYVTDTGNHVIRRIDLSGTIGVTTIAGTVTLGAGVAGTANGSPGTTAQFTSPYALALNAAGNALFVADRNNHAIRKVDLASSNAVTTFAGTVGTSGATDSPGLFKNPEGIAIDAGDVVYVSDSGNATVRKITSAGIVSTLAGTAGQSGFTDGLSTAAKFQEPFGIAVHSSGVIYVTDAPSHTVRRLAVATAPSVTTPVSTPGGNAVTSGGTISFATTLTGSPAPAVTWQMQPAAGGGFAALTIAAPYSVVTTATTSTLTITGATAALNGNQYRVFASNGVPADQTSSAVTLTVNQPPAMANVTTTGSFTVGTSSTFNFTATGSPAPTLSILSGNYPVNAVLTQTPSGSTTSGTITWQPSQSEVSGSPYAFTVKATNGFGSDATQAFTLSVLTGPSIGTQPTNPTVSPGQNAQFTVVATSNGGTLTYKWQRQAAGTLGFSDLVESGVYLGTNTATLTVVSASQPMSGDQFQVVVSSGIGTPATSSPATLTVTQPPQITSLNTASFVENQLSSFQVQATGSPSTITYSLTSGTLPSGLSLNSLTGAISGTPATGTSATSPYLLQITASNGVNPAATQSLTLTVTPTALAPAFTTQPISLTVALGQTATYTVAVTGNPTPTLRWQRLAVGSGAFVDLADDSTFGGTGTVTLTITNPTSGMSGDVFRANAVNTSGTTPSSNATLTLVIGTTISTLAGQATVAGSTDATGTAARFNGPAAVAVDASGNLYIADSSNHVIRKVTTGGVVTTLAGSPGIQGSADGTGSAARFNAPSGVAVTSLGTVYVADTYNHIIRVISPEGVVTTLAGLAGSTGSTDNTGNAARFLYPYGIAVDSGGTAYVADTFNHTIRKVSSAGVVTTFAGTAGARGTANQVGAAARFAYPFAVALDSGANLYVADSFNHSIRKIDTAASVTTLAGSPGTPGSTDGTGSGALFNQPSGLTVDSSGNVYVADTYSNTIRRVTSGGIVTTLAGLAGTAGSVDGVGSAARFNQPFGIAVDATGNLFVADTRNHTIRRSGNVAAPTISTQPQSTVAVAGGNATFTVAATGSPTPSIFTWLRQPNGTSGFTAVTADSVYSGVNTATLTVTGVTPAMSGDQFQVVVSNLISPNATSGNVTLTVGTAPVFTSAATANFQATNAGTHTLVATGSPTPTFTATGLPSWASLNTTTGVISGTPPDTTGSPFSITATATNGIAVNQTLVLTVLPAVLPPTITTAPSGTAANQGSAAVFSVAVAGTPPFTYQWSRNGAAISGATGANLSLSNVQLSNAGNYTVTVTNAAGSVTSPVAVLTVNTIPVLAQQPRSQTALAGSVVTFSATATGGTSFTYQWRKNGTAIAGATGATLTLTGVTSADAGNYDVLVANALGTIGSSLAQLNVVSAPVAPVISSQPASRTIVIGASTTLSVGASGAPTPTFQWRKNGADISGATNTSFAVTGVQSGSDNYDVVIRNSAGSVTTAAAAVRVLARSYSGTYFGSFAGSIGSFAIFIRDDNTGVFLGYLPGSTAPVMTLSLVVNDTGTFSFSQGAIAAAGSVSPNSDEPARAAALSTVVVSGTIGADGNVTGALAGGVNAAISASRAFDTGATQGVAGFYQAGASNSGAVSYTIAGPNSQAFAVVQAGTATDGGSGTVTVAGAVNVVTSRSIISTTISPAAGTVTGSATGALSASFSGASEAVLARQRLVNISSRARVATGDNVAIAGFVISGQDSKPVLIRAVGPTLGAAPFNVAGALASPRLELFRGQTSLGVNTGIAADRVAIDAAGVQSGAFALGSSGADAAILTTLAPGAYTAVVSSTTNTAGVALVEVYDLSAAAPGQKLLNIATRASAGTGDATLIAGFVVPAGSTKRVLVRGVGPGLSVFGVTGVLAQPTLQLLSGSTTVAQNTNWSTSTDRDAIASSSALVGAFGLATNDSAVIATLAPGNYTAIVSGAGGATGVALIEVYELP